MHDADADVDVDAGVGGDVDFAGSIAWISLGGFFCLPCWRGGSVLEIVDVFFRRCQFDLLAGGPVQCRSWKLGLGEVRVIPV